MDPKSNYNESDINRFKIYIAKTTLTILQPPLISWLIVRIFSHAAFTQKGKNLPWKAHWSQQLSRDKKKTTNANLTWINQRIPSTRADVRCAWKLGIVNGFGYHSNHLFHDLFYR